MTRQERQSPSQCSNLKFDLEIKDKITYYGTQRARNGNRPIRTGTVTGLNIGDSSVTVITDTDGKTEQVEVTRIIKEIGGSSSTIAPVADPIPAVDTRKIIGSTTTFVCKKRVGDLVEEEDAISCDNVEILTTLEETLDESVLRAHTVRYSRDKIDETSWYTDFHISTLLKYILIIKKKQHSTFFVTPQYHQAYLWNKNTGHEFDASAYIPTDKDKSSIKFLIIPIGINNQWTGFFVDIDAKSITYYNPTTNQEDDTLDYESKIDALQPFFEKYGLQFDDFKNNVVTFRPRSTMKQVDGYNCGRFW
uniref:Ubiquitin-like protease family profile domain-containing protein n=1 Tax=Panagrolaimus superbus TaxID=310955 RepID=A0A914Y1J6_9BILA